MHRWWLPLALVVAAVASVALADSEEEEDPISHGFGKNLPWVKWENARDLAKMQRKPVMVIIHKSWCHACKALKTKFQQKSAQQQLGLLAKHFIISNTEDDEEPWEDEFKPDGQYIPRVIFCSPDGEVLTDVVNDKAEYDKYKFYYTNPAQIMTSMRNVMQRYGLGAAKDAPPASEPPKDAKAPSQKPPEKEL